VLLLLFALAPLYFGFTSAFKAPLELFGIPPTLYPENPSLGAFNVLLASTAPTFWRGLVNSTIVSAITAFVTAFLALPGGYALARFAFRGKTVAWLTFFVTQVAGSAAFLVIPMYVVVNWLGIYDTYWAMLLPYIAGGVPFSSLLMSGFVANIPPAVEEVAMVHGSSRFGVIYKITLPLILPGLFSAVIFSFTGTFSEFILATSLTATDAARTAFPMLWIYYTAPFGEWSVNSLFAGILLLSLPVIILFILLQRRFVEGFTKGMLKM